MAFNEKEIEEKLNGCFCQDPPNAMFQLTGVCRNVADEEAVEESSVFLGKRAGDITPEIWRKSWSALSFLSDEAFVYFIPSLIRASLFDHQSTINAVDSFLFSASRITKNYTDNNAGMKRWDNLSIDQIESIQKWIDWLERFHPSDYSYLGDAKDNLERLKNRRKKSFTQQ